MEQAAGCSPGGERATGRLRELRWKVWQRAGDVQAEIVQLTVRERNFMPVQ